MSNRLVERVAAAFRQRQELWSEQLSRELSAPGVFRPDRLGAVLVDSRRRLEPLWNLATSPLLPSDLQDAMQSALSETIESAQEHLLESAARLDPSGLIADTVSRHGLARSVPARGADTHGGPEARQDDDPPRTILFR